MSYTVSQQITNNLDFSCSNGEITLSNEQGFFVPLDHKEMTLMVSTWLKCVDLELSHAERVTIEHALKLRAV
jgi:hypothetical protein